MAIVTADDVRKLARSEHEDDVLALVDGRIELTGAAQLTAGKVIYTRQQLINDTGVELTDMEAETLAASLTANIATT